jgi:hypothetical protein
MRAKSVLFFLSLIFVGFVSLPAGPVERALIVVEDPPPSAVSRLIDDGVLVVQDMGRYLLIASDGDTPSKIANLGLTYEVLDESMRGNSYYVVFPRSNASLEDLGDRVRVLMADRFDAVIEAEPDQAVALAAAGFEIARVFVRPIRPSEKRRAPFPYRVSTQVDSLIHKIVEAVSGASVDAYVQRLQDFESRWAHHDSCQAAANYIKAQFDSFGIDSVYFHYFSPIFTDNVVAVIPGVSQPDKMIVIGGHYDAVTAIPDSCPGADDNASGTSCVLECARVLSGYEFDYTLVFIAFGAEEQGLLGSETWAAEAAARGDDIVAMLNVDMIGYLHVGDVLDLDIVTNASSEWLRDRAVDAGALYVPELDVVTGSTPGGAGSDHVSFWNHGYDAIMFFEDSDNYSPYMHTVSDVVGLSYNSPTLAERSVKLAAALLADLAGVRHDPTGIAGGGVPEVTAITLAQCTPNPFNPRTSITFSVEPPGREVALKIYDVTGREIRTLIDNEAVTGTRTVWWNGTDNQGRHVASGVYLYRLTSKTGESVTRKMVLVR